MDGNFAAGKDISNLKDTTMTVIDSILDFLAKYINPILIGLGIILLLVVLFFYIAPKKYQKEYHSIVRFLCKIKLLAIFLSHGGLHLLLFFFFFLWGCALIGIVKNESIASFHQVVYTFYGDTLKNYKLSHLNLKKDLSRREGNMINDNDILVYYEFRRDDSLSNIPLKTIKPFKNVDSVDLVSKVRMVIKNEKPLEIEENPIQPRHFYHDFNQVHRRVKYSNKDRYIYYYTTVKSQSHSYDHSFAGEDLEKNYEKKNPYYSFWLGLNFECEPALDDSSSIRFLFNKVDVTKAHEGMEEPINIEKIIPEPSEYTVSAIMYTGKEKIQEVIDNGGIYITAVDPVLKAKSEEKQIIYTVLAGTIFAFCIDLFVQLIIKWRRLKKNEE